MRATNPEELSTAIEEGFSANKPTIIEVPVGAFPEPFDVIRPPATRGKKT